MIGPSELRIVRIAHPAAPRQLRHALRAFLEAFALESELVEDVLLAAGEVLANAIEHGHDGRRFNTIELRARSGPDGSLCVEVSDEGTFIERERLPNRGFGLTIVRAIARDVAIETGSGTRVRMIFDARRVQAAR